MFNSICDPLNKDASCKYDGLDCAYPETCSKDSFLDINCNIESNVTECGWDFGSCDDQYVLGNEYLCLADESLRGDGLCDLLNNVKECGHDGDDCNQNRAADSAILLAVGRLTNPINSVEVVFPNGTQGLTLPRAPYKIDSPLAFNHAGTLILCGGRTRSSYILNSCIGLEYKSYIGVEDSYLLWKYRASMLVPTLFSALEIIELEGKKYAWMTGGEITNTGRVFLVGATTSTYLYDLALDQWEESVDLQSALAGHCMVKITDTKLLLAGGYRDNAQVSRNVVTFEIVNGKMNARNFKVRGPLRTARRFPACGLFEEGTGRTVPIVASGLDNAGNPLSSVEMFFDINGEFKLISALPAALPYGSVNVINNRILYMGGFVDSVASDNVFIYNEETGWHLSNMNLNTARFSHTSVVLDTQELGQSYPETPNIFVTLGKDANEVIPASEVMCMSQRPSYFSAYCSRDGDLDFSLEAFGSVTLLHKNFIYSCGGLINGQVTSVCYQIDPSVIVWTASETLSLSEPRMFPAITLSATGDWIISGGYNDEPSESKHVTSRGMEIVNERVQRKERDMPISLSQHCIVHLHCYYYFYAGGTSIVSNLALPSAYYQHVKTGNYHKLKPMKVARSNHVCFAEPGKGKHKKIYVVGGRNWIEQDGVLTENILRSTEIFDTETETWSDGPDLPTPLAYATVVSTPLAVFILGGKTLGDDPTSATNQVIKLTNLGGTLGWEILPNKLDTARIAPSALSLNTKNVRGTKDQDCSTDFPIKTPKTYYGSKPVNFGK